MKAKIEMDKMEHVYKKLTPSAIQRFLKRKLTGIYTFQDFWEKYLGYSSEEEFNSAFRLLNFQNHESILNDLKNAKPPKGKKGTTKVKSVPEKTHDNVAIGEDAMSKTEEVEGRVSIKSVDVETVDAVVEETVSAIVDAIVEEIEKDSDTNATPTQQEIIEAEMAAVDTRMRDINSHISMLDEDIKVCKDNIYSIAEEANRIAVRLHELLHSEQENRESIERLEHDRSESRGELEELSIKREELNAQLQQYRQLKILFSLTQDATCVDERCQGVVMADDIENQYGIREEDRYQQIPALIAVDGTILQKTSVLKKVANILCLKQILNNKEIILILENADEYLLDLFGKLGINCNVL